MRADFPQQQEDEAMLSIELYRRMMGALHKAVERRRSRRQLTTLSDEMMKDIGVSRADAMRESGKPFWRA
jgi:uncharacterized protein YjiS (DUF1127 family)